MDSWRAGFVGEEDGSGHSSVDNRFVWYYLHTELTVASDSISTVPGWTRSTLKARAIRGRSKICARSTSETRLAIQFTGVQITFTEPSRVAPRAYAALVNECAIVV